jgi:hypothetical protein
MTVIDISAARPSRNPPLSKPIFKTDQIAKCISEIDESITMLEILADNAALHEDDEPRIKALHFIYRRLKTETDRLCMLL